MSKQIPNGLTQEQAEFLEFLGLVEEFAKFQAMKSANVSTPKTVETLAPAPKAEPVLTAGQASLDYNEAMSRLADDPADRRRYQKRAKEVKAAIAAKVPWTLRPAGPRAKARRTRALNRLNDNK